MPKLSGRLAEPAVDDSTRALRRNAGWVSILTIVSVFSILLTFEWSPKLEKEVEFFPIKSTRMVLLALDFDDLRDIPGATKFCLRLAFGGVAESHASLRFPQSIPASLRRTRHSSWKQGDRRAAWISATPLISVSANESEAALVRRTGRSGNSLGYTNQPCPQRIACLSELSGVACGSLNTRPKFTHPRHTSQADPADSGSESCQVPGDLAPLFPVAIGGRPIQHSNNA